MAAVLHQQFDTAGLRAVAAGLSADHFRAVNALIKGDAAHVGNGYAGTYFTRDQVAELSAPVGDNKLLQAPRIVFETVTFEQTEGFSFVANLFGAGDSGWDGVDEAYLRPPVSTEQVLHPEKYYAREQPVKTIVPDISAEIGKGWFEVSSNTMGEVLIRTFLEEHLDTIQAEDAAAGWAGDGYSLLLGPEGERLLILQIRWDTLADSDEFFDAYRVFAGIKTQGEGGGPPSWAKAASLGQRRTSPW